MGRVVWSVREGRAGDFEAPEIVGSFRSAWERARRRVSRWL